MRNFGIVVICVGLGVMVVGLANITAWGLDGKKIESYIFPVIYIGAWFSFIGCLTSIIGSIWPRKRQ